MAWPPTLEEAKLSFSVRQVFIQTHNHYERNPFYREPPIKSFTNP